MDEIKTRILDKKTECEQIIKDRFGLQKAPDIWIVERDFEILSDRWRHELASSNNVIEPSEYYGQELKAPVDMFRNHYPQLFWESDKNQPFQVVLLEAQVSIGSVLTSAGYDWLISGSLQDGKTMAAVLSFQVRELFRGCKISSLIKLGESRLAQEKGCQFVHTYLKADNIRFIPAIVPQLKNGAIFYHGESDAGEVYEENGYIHLRTYFDGKPRQSVVCFEKDGIPTLVLKSPDENEQIIDHLTTIKRVRYRGRTIREISKLKE